MKTCTKCGEEKPLDQYHRDSKAPGGLRRNCKLCVKTRMRKYYQDNRPVISERQREYWPRYYESNRERIIEKTRDYQRNNAEKHKAYCAGWREDNRHVFWESRFKRRAGEYGITPRVVSFTRAELIAQYGDACIDCGGAWTDVDHVIPVRFGGEHSLDNCEPVCHPCNKSRWHRYQREAYDLMTNIYSGEAA